MAVNLSIAVHDLSMHLLTLLSVDEILLPIYCKINTYTLISEYSYDQYWLC